MELAHNAQRLLHDALRPEHHCLGRDALPANVQRGARDVPPDLRRSMLVAPKVDRD
jgi:hypothetical protein